MELHELPFAKIIILRDDIAEVMINDGVRMDTAMVEHSSYYHVPYCGGGQERSRHREALTPTSAASESTGDGP